MLDTYGEAIYKDSVSIVNRLFWSFPSRSHISKVSITFVFNPQTVSSSPLPAIMKFSATAGALLLASTALALPSPAALEKMQERRHERFRKRLATRREKGNFPLAVNHTAMNDHVLLGPSKHVSYDSNWAGAVQVGTGITEVTATFNNPKVSSSSSQAGAAAWVGIDGDTCQSGRFYIQK